MATSSDDAIDDDASAPRGEVIGRVQTRSTLRPAPMEPDEASERADAEAIRRTDPRADGDLPSVERVRTSLVDALGTDAADAPPAPSRLETAPSRARALVEELRQCGPGDEQAMLEPLRHLGREALVALAADFPGLTWFDRRLPHRRIPRGRDATPVARLLVALGPPAVPFVRELLARPSLHERFYALLVAADMEPPMVAAVVDGLFDEEHELRALCLELLGLVTAGDGGAEAAVHAGSLVRARLSAAACNPIERLAALDALAALKDPEAVPLLPDFLTWVERDVVDRAHRALCLTTGRDLGTDPIAWRRWVRWHGREGRPRWLVGALGDRSAERRRYAHEELLRLVGEDFGYSPDLGFFRRFLAQRRCLALVRRSALGLSRPRALL